MNILKERRISLGLSVDDISQTLNIRKCYLNALEDYTIVKLIDMVYVNGYLKLYSSYLGIKDCDEVLKNCLLQEDNILKNKTPLAPKVSAPKTFSSKTENSKKKKYILLSIILISIISSNIIYSNFFYDDTLSAIISSQKNNKKYD